MRPGSRWALGFLALLGEDRVDLAAALVEQLADPLLLPFVGGVEHLADRVVQLVDRVAQMDLLGVGAGTHCLPGGLLAGLLLLLFLLDVVLAVPFGGTSVVVDIFGVLVCGLVLYLAYDAFRDLR